jgi:hypothetical protein
VKLLNIKNMRKINDKLMSKLISGDLNPLLEYVRLNKEDLRLEVRQGGKFMIYYRKGKALEVGLKSWKADPKYGADVPNPILAKENPSIYFEKMIPVIDNWLVEKKKRNEFDTQQNIARDNQDNNDKYVILDMEYNFSQDAIKKENRIKSAGFDLLGIERKTGKIVFLEVKKGAGALTGKSGIATHIKDFEEYLYGKHKDVFRKQLRADVENIVNDKKKLGLIDYDLPIDLSADNVDFVFVFESDNCTKEKYNEIYTAEYKASGSIRKYPTIFVSQDNYKL